MPDQVIRIGTRASRLALTQTGQVAAQLVQLNPNVRFETVTITTEGDADHNTALKKLGGQGLFTKRIEKALLDHEINIAVHSAKDLPSVMTEGLTLAAVPTRESVCDAWLCTSGEKLREIRSGAVVGTGSPRRHAQLLHFRPDLKVEGIRGNVDTRLRKLSEGRYDAIVMAHAGLIRGSIDQSDAHRCADIERRLLEKLGAGCSTPVGGYARLVEGRCHLTAVVLDNRGKTRLCVSHDIGQSDDNETLLDYVVGHLLEQGAQELIAGDK